MNKRNLFLVILLTILVALFLSRLVLPREIDDVSPEIYCEADYLAKSDVLWIIPKFSGVPINENPEWCAEILSLNKTLGLHGYEHSYEEFSRRNFTTTEINESIEIFRSCFGFYPTMFKAPQLSLNRQNRNLIETFNLTIRGWLNQIIHKVYHCNGNSTTEKFGAFPPNWFHDLI